MSNKELSKTKKWLLAIGAVLAHQNNMSHEYLYELEDGDSMLDDEYMESTKHVLKRDWDISNKEEMESSVEWILNKGHSKNFDEVRNYITCLSENAKKSFLGNLNSERRAMYEIVCIYDKDLPLAGIRAWDYGRYVNLSRDAVLLGYFTEEEFWTRLYKLGKRVQSEYSSWREYAIAYFVGRQFWLDLISEDYAKTHFEYANTLLYKEDGPWGNLDWSTELVL